MDEYNLEARWVNLGEREPNHDDEVFARKTAEDFLTVIYFAEEGDIKYSINGESYIFEDQMDQWEWLELRPKEKLEPSVPLPDGRTLEVNEFHDLAEMFRLQHHLNSRIGADMVDVDAVGDKEAIARWTQKFVTAMQQELAELVDCVPWKWWRPEEAQPYDRQNARVEIVDLFHFLISLSQLHGMSAEDVYNTYRAKCQINHKRQDSGYLKKDPDDCKCI
jgi:dimeric dUTPase (all-alpha-NTP-PPase superfamily)